MVRDYSQFMSGADASKVEKPALSGLQQLGWQAFFSAQVDADALVATPPVRVTEVHKSGANVRGDGFDGLIPPGVELAVGDWLLFDEALPTHSVLLDRKSLFKRRAAGHAKHYQLIAANVDTVFVVTSCNQDFNIARLERFIALAFESDVVPVIVLTKADLCDDTQPYIDQAQAISDRVPVIAIDAKAGNVAGALADWSAPGQTIAFLGTSGVGKSTLVNALFDTEQAATSGIREDDARGRHTTTARQLHFTEAGLGVLDTPGMRELQLADAESGIADLFSDVVELAAQCKFNDCAHETEPGCKVRAAIEDGTLDAARLERWRKLAAEERHNTATLSERRAYDKDFGKMIRTVTKAHKGRKGRR